MHSLGTECRECRRRSSAVVAAVLFVGSLAGVTRRPGGEGAEDSDAWRACRAVAYEHEVHFGLLAYGEILVAFGFPSYGERFSFSSNTSFAADVQDRYSSQQRSILFDTAAVCTLIEGFAREDYLSPLRVSLSNTVFGTPGNFMRHLVGDWLGAQALAKGRVLELLGFLDATLAPDNQNPSELHGVIWSVLVRSAARDAAVFWRRASELCGVAGHLGFCLHGVGHAVFLEMLVQRAAVPEYLHEACPQINLNSLHLTSEMVRDGEGWCHGAPDANSADLCLTGYYHSAAQYVAGSLDTWMYHCRLSGAPDLCSAFFLNHHGRIVLARADWAADDFRCAPYEGELALDCIRFVSYYFYPTYDAVQRAGPAELGSASDLILSPRSCGAYVNDMNWFVSRRMRALWAPRAPLPPSALSFHTWCSEFAAAIRRLPDRQAEGAWIACLEGAVGGAVRAGSRAALAPSDIARYCTTVFAPVAAGPRWAAECQRLLGGQRLNWGYH